MAVRIGSEHGDKQFWLSNQIHIEIDPFKPDKFRFIYFEVDEWMGGQLPKGKLQMRATELPKQEKVIERTDFFKVTIEQDDPVDKYEIYCFVIGREWSPANGEFLLDFVCVPNTDEGKTGTFYTMSRRKLFRDKKIKEVIEATWKDLGPPRFRWKTDADPPPEDWWQDRWSDLEFLRRLCLSVKTNTLYCFDIEGLMIKDIYWFDRVTGKPEPHRVATGYESHQPVQDNITSRHNYKLYRDIENPCTEKDYKYGREISKNLQLEIHEDTYRVFHKDFERRQGVYKYNSRLLDTNLYSGVVLRYTDNLPPLRLMDTIKYGKGNEEEEPTISIYTVTSAHFFISGDTAHRDEMGSMCSFEFVLRGTEDVLGQELPDSEAQDPGLQ
jgi:hypothetical protein